MPPANVNAKKMPFEHYHAYEPVALRGDRCDLM